MRHGLLPTLGLSLALALESGCGPTKVTTETTPFVARYQVRTLAVLPFETLDTPQVLTDDAESLHVPSAVKKSDIAIAVPPDIPTAAQRTTTVNPKAGETVTRLMWERLGARAGLTVRPLDDAVIAVREVSGREKTAIGEHVAAAVGKKMGVDGVVTGKVSVYKERVGSRIGAEAAAVGYEVRLYGPDGQLLWLGNYFEKQRPMIEDLWGFIERRGAFVTAAELAAYGAEKMLKNFPYGRMD